MRIDRLAARELGEFWSLREDVTVRFGRRTVLRTPWGELCIHRPGSLLCEALRRMQLGPVSLANVVPGFPGYDVPESEWNDASRELLDALDPLQHVIVRHLAIGASPLLSVIPVSPHATFHPPSDPPPDPDPFPPGGGFRPLEEAVPGRPGRDPVLSYEGRDHRVELRGPDAPKLLLHFQLGDGASRPPVDGRLPETVVRAARAYVVAAGMLSPVDPDPPGAIGREQRNNREQRNSREQRERREHREQRENRSSTTDPASGLPMIRTGDVLPTEHSGPWGTGDSSTGRSGGDDFPRGRSQDRSRGGS
ncbi:hypothetical protein [Streptomyces sp. NPDC006691]|uniref:hypothetical protein n=1 Tax=Streptomyces sp. NPDC006691 TaxID=3364757 RepID=UPI0036C6E791